MPSSSYLQIVQNLLEALYTPCTISTFHVGILVIPPS